MRTVSAPAPRKGRPRTAANRQTFVPEITITLSQADRSLIERVQAARGMPTLEAAAEWLIKTRLRRAVRMSTGRGRALYLAATGKGTAR